MEAGQPVGEGLQSSWRQRFIQANEEDLQEDVMLLNDRIFSKFSKL